MVKDHLEQGGNLGADNNKVIELETCSPSYRLYSIVCLFTPFIRRNHFLLEGVVSHATAQSHDGTIAELNMWKNYKSF